MVNPSEAPWHNSSVEAKVKQLMFSLKTFPERDMSLLEFKILPDYIVFSILKNPLGVNRDLV